MAQYGRRNKLVLSGIPESVSEDVLEESVISVLVHIDFSTERQDIEACDRFGKPDRDKSQKTNARFVNKKLLFNKEKISSSNCSKHNFMQNSKIFANENLTPKNESIA